MAIDNIRNILDLMNTKKASDLFLTAGSPPSIKIGGQIQPLTKTPLTPEKTKETVTKLMSSKQKEEFETTNECNFAINKSGSGRFRVSAFNQRSMVGAVIRRIETVIPTIQELNLPDSIPEMIMAKRGLILVVGATGSGKSSSLAAMIGHRSRKSNGHLLTIEDPIEFVHQHNQCIVTQREVGTDTDSFEIALKNALRQSPDVIMIGEIRTKQTMQYALQFAETGHLCVATLHANTASQALDRIINFFPSDQHNQIWNDLSLNLRAIVAQQLIKTNSDQRLPAVEVLINTPLASDLIRKGNVHDLKELMKNSTEHGMQTFDGDLYRLYDNGQISYDDAMKHADSENDLRLLIKLNSTNSDTEYLYKAAESLEIMPEIA